jgi:hypothetical protein
VDEERQHLVAGVVAAAMLARAHRALDHRVHDLQVRRVEREREVHRAARGLDVRREALVVLHVARGELVGVLALELAEEVRRDLAERVHEHVQAPAVGHADHDFLGAVRAGVLDHGVEHRDQALAALAREALLPDVARVQVALEGLGGGDALEDPLLLRGSKAGVESVPSKRFWIQRFSSVEEMYMYSMPMVPQ